MKINGEFSDMSEAFSFCRECDRSVIVQVDGKKYRLFPNGKAEELPDKVSALNYSKLMQGGQQ